MTESALAFAEDAPREPAPTSDMNGLLLNLNGYEGPIDVLLQLARDQKVDLTQISILQLARQFLAFIDQAQSMRLDLAAEYLVMAAWLAYLKSRLLLPQEPRNGNEPTPEDMAAALAYQLRRVEAMQQAAHQLWGLPQRNRDFFARGYIEPADTATHISWTASLYDVLRAYGDIRARKERGKTYELPTFNLMSMEDALARLTQMLGALPKQGHQTVWATLQNFIPETTDPLYHRSAVSSVLTASLEMAKQGKLEIRQDGPFRPIYMRGTLAPDQPKDTQHG